MGLIQISSHCRICNEHASVVLGEPSSKIVSCKKCGLVLAAAKPIGGFVYVLSNKCMPGLVKIGFSTREVEARVAELNASTSIPEPFKIEAFFPVERPLEQEAAVHAKIAGLRHAQNREFFRLNVDEAVAVVKKSLLFEPTADQPAGSEGAVKVFASASRRGVLVKLCFVTDVSGNSEGATTPDGQCFELAATFLFTNRDAFAAKLRFALAHSRDGYGVWDVKVEEAVTSLARITREHQASIPVVEKKLGPASSNPPAAPIFWSADEKAPRTLNSQGGFGSSRYD